VEGVQKYSARGEAIIDEAVEDTVRFPEMTGLILPLASVVLLGCADEEPSIAVK
jgi:hypothetical protein